MDATSTDGAPVAVDELLRAVSDPVRAAADGFHAALRPLEVGRVVSIGRGVARVRGLSRVQAEELLRFRGNRYGQAFDVSETEVGVILLDRAQDLQAGDEVHRTGRVLDVPVGTAVLGRVIDPLGRPLDGGPPPAAAERFPVERDAPAILDRAAVSRPLQTGVKVVDALIPVGRGQRELILGDRQIGKTAIALDAIVNQRDTGVVCVYCAIGQRNTAVAKVIDALRRRGAMDYTAVVVGADDMPPGLQFVAPYAATSVAEWFMHQGRDVLIVYDDLTTHARAYRELSLLLRRPPGREAYPGDVFYLHSRLLERSTQLADRLGGGSLTALPIAETEAQNVAAYIPTNLISITDGQIYLSPDLFQKGILPAVDVGRSVSRVGGSAQLPAYRAVTGPLRLSYAQFEELEAFARFSSRLDEKTRQVLERGRRIRQVFQQSQFEPRPVELQIALLLAVTQGVLDELSLEQIPEFESRLRRRLEE
ncbi:MAG: alternate F1F0 ATPase, F1 subunit alpha, partial [Planctomycetota bacterium]